MTTKAQIIQRLLEEKKINAEEAVTLMLNDQQIVYVPYYPASPYYPVAPVSPYYPLNPVLPYYQVTCNALSN